MNEYDIYMLNGSWFATNVPGVSHQAAADYITAKESAKRLPLIRTGDTLIVVRDGGCASQGKVRCFKVEAPPVPTPTANLIEFCR